MNSAPAHALDYHPSPRVKEDLKRQIALYFPYIRKCFRCERTHACGDFNSNTVLTRVGILIQFMIGSIRLRFVYFDKT